MIDTTQYPPDGLYYTYPQAWEHDLLVRDHDGTILARCSTPEGAEDEMTRIARQRQIDNAITGERA